MAHKIKQSFVDAKMTKTFSERVRSNEIKQPTQRGFSEEKWKKLWNDSKNKTDECYALYDSGMEIYSCLEGLRAALDRLYKSRPDIEDKKLIQCFVAMSNRDRTILIKSSTEKPLKTRNVMSLMLKNNKHDNEISAIELADGSIDAVQKALSFCKTRINSKTETQKIAQNATDPFEFVLKEAYFSQIYGIIESYWQAILWCGYNFRKSDIENKYIIEQEKSDLEVRYERSLIRRFRIEGQRAQMSVAPSIRNNFNNDNYIYFKKEGRNKKIKSRNIESAPDLIKYLNSNFRVSTLYLEDDLPNEFLMRELTAGFSLRQVLEVFRLLVLFSHICVQSFPEDDSFHNINKLLEFCPSFKQSEIQKGLSSATGYPVHLVKKIVHFLEFNGSASRDLYSHPLISVGDKYCILTSSFTTPFLLRVVEHWIVELGLDLGEKGPFFESSVAEEINNTIKNNPIISDYDECVSKRIKLVGSEEEIDLLFRIGNTIFLGEAKSIVTTDSPISRYRTLGTLKKASEQVIRKMEFLKENIEKIFQELGWTHDSEVCYKVVGCIVKSGQIYSGIVIDDVPVCDRKIIKKYLSDNIVPLFSQFNKNTNEFENLAWFVLYRDVMELQSNFMKYLISPPQISDSIDDFETKDVEIHVPGERSVRLIYRRLVMRDVPIIQKLRRQTNFELHEVPNIESKIESFDVYY